MMLILEHPASFDGPRLSYQTTETTERTVQINVERWRNRIRECRKMHEEIKSQEGQQSLKVVIESYEKMIERELRERR
jgi:hypothetical protein